MRKLPDKETKEESLLHQTINLKVRDKWISGKLYYNDIITVMGIGITLRLAIDWGQVMAQVVSLRLICKWKPLCLIKKTKQNKTDGRNGLCSIRKQDRNKGSIPPLINKVSMIQYMKWYLRKGENSRVNKLINLQLKTFRHPFLPEVTSTCWQMLNDASIEVLLEIRVLLWPSVNIALFCCFLVTYDSAYVSCASWHPYFNPKHGHFLMLAS